MPSLGNFFFPDFARSLYVFKESSDCCLQFFYLVDGDVNFYKIGNNKFLHTFLFCQFLTLGLHSLKYMYLTVVYCVFLSAPVWIRVWGIPNAIYISYNEHMYHLTEPKSSHRCHQNVTIVAQLLGSFWSLFCQSGKWWLWSIKDNKYKQFINKCTIDMNSMYWCPGISIAAWLWRKVRILWHQRGR